MNNDLISQVIIYILKKDYLYGLVLSRFTYVEDDKCGTIGVCLKNKHIICHYNLEFIQSFKSLDSLSKVLIHEVLHIVFQHHDRIKERDQTLWNIAADLAVNSLIAGIEEAVPDGLFAENFGFPVGLTAEQYYGLLKDKKEGSVSTCVLGEGNGKVSVKLDNKDIGSFSPLSGSVDELTKSEIEKELTKALDKCYNYGTLPNNQVVNAIVDFSHYKSINWKTVLNSFIGYSQKKSKYSTYSRPNRRFGWGSKGYLSSYTAKVVFAIDTSASMDIEVLSKIQNELEKIRKVRNVDIDIIECDAKVQEHYKFRVGKPINLSFYGGGGTSFIPVFQYIKDKGMNPDGLIYFTDLYGMFPNDKPRYPVLWISTSRNTEVPFGKVLRIE